MTGETYEILNEGAASELEVRVRFTTTTEVATNQTYSEQEVLNTIAHLERSKLEYCEQKDAEIEVNNQMLAKIRAIDRTLNASG